MASSPSPSPSATGAGGLSKYRISDEFNARFESFQKRMYAQQKEIAIRKAAEEGIQLEWSPRRATVTGAESTWNELDLALNDGGHDAGGQAEAIATPTKAPPLGPSLPSSQPTPPPITTTANTMAHPNPEPTPPTASSSSPLVAVAPSSAEAAGPSHEEAGHHRPRTKPSTTPGTSPRDSEKSVSPVFASPPLCDSPEGEGEGGTTATPSSRDQSVTPRAAPKPLPPASPSSAKSVEGRGVASPPPPSDDGSIVRDGETFWDPPSPEELALRTRDVWPEERERREKHELELEQLRKELLGEVELDGGKSTSTRGKKEDRNSAKAMSRMLKDSLERDRRREERARKAEERARKEKSRGGNGDDDSLASTSTTAPASTTSPFSSLKSPTSPTPLSPKEDLRGQLLDKLRHIDASNSVADRFASSTSPRSPPHALEESEAWDPEDDMPSFDRVDITSPPLDTSGTLTPAPFKAMSNSMAARNVPSHGDRRIAPVWEGKPTHRTIHGVFVPVNENPVKDGDRWVGGEMKELWIAKGGRVDEWRRKSDRWYLPRVGDQFGMSVMSPIGTEESSSLYSLESKKNKTREPDTNSATSSTPSTPTPRSRPAEKVKLTADALARVTPPDSEDDIRRWRTSATPSLGESSLPDEPTKSKGSVPALSSSIPVAHKEGMSPLGPPIGKGALGLDAFKDVEGGGGEGGGAASSSSRRVSPRVGGGGIGDGPLPFPTSTSTASAPPFAWPTRRRKDSFGLLEVAPIPVDPSRPPTPAYNVKKQDFASDLVFRSRPTEKREFKGVAVGGGGEGWLNEEERREQRRRFRTDGSSIDQGKEWGETRWAVRKKLQGVGKSFTAVYEDLERRHRQNPADTALLSQMGHLHLNEAIDHNIRELSKPGMEILMRSLQLDPSQIEESRRVAEEFEGVGDYATSSHYWDMATKSGGGADAHDFYRLARACNKKKPAEPARSKEALLECLDMEPDAHVATMANWELGVTLEYMDRPPDLHFANRWYNKCLAALEDGERDGWGPRGMPPRPKKDIVDRITATEKAIGGKVDPRDVYATPSANTSAKASVAKDLNTAQTTTSIDQSESEDEIVVHTVSPRTKPPANAAPSSPTPQPTKPATSARSSPTSASFRDVPVAVVPVPVPGAPSSRSSSTAVERDEGKVPFPTVKESVISRDDLDRIGSWEPELARERAQDRERDSATSTDAGSVVSKPITDTSRGSSVIEVGRELTMADWASLPRSSTPAEKRFRDRVLSQGHRRRAEKEVGIQTRRVASKPAHVERSLDAGLRSPLSKTPRRGSFQRRMIKPQSALAHPQFVKAKGDSAGSDFLPMMASSLRKLLRASDAWGQTGAELSHSTVLVSKSLEGLKNAMKTHQSSASAHNGQVSSEIQALVEVLADLPERLVAAAHTVPIKPHKSAPPASVQAVLDLLEQLRMNIEKGAGGGRTEIMS
ncbi:hypothetical protein MNV49_005333 [Pseudohyphozyma bogoriensis]|nr:hypothetical protein MNV49_005333 [Pseudohyphozyma bogoriensis]